MDTQNMLNATIKNGHGWIQNTISEVENTLSYLRGLQKQYKEEQERADALGTSCILVNAQQAIQRLNSSYSLSMLSKIAGGILALKEMSREG